MTGPIRWEDRALLPSLTPVEKPPSRGGEPQGEEPGGVLQQDLDTEKLETQRDALFPSNVR